MAGVTESRYPVVMGFDAHAFPISLLVGMSCNDGVIV
jgi:hypothetical protein